MLKSIKQENVRHNPTEIQTSETVNQPWKAYIFIVGDFPIEFLEWRNTLPWEHKRSHSERSNQFGDDHKSFNWHLKSLAYITDRTEWWHYDPLEEHRLARKVPSIFGTWRRRFRTASISTKSAFINKHNDDTKSNPGARRPWAA